MSAQDIVKQTLSHSTYRIKRAFEGLPEEQMDRRPTAEAMSPREILEHLSECYQAYLDICEGREPEWGSFKVPDRSTPALMSTWSELRDRAVAKASSTDDPRALQNALDYVILHDEYHVGQICLLRMQHEPDWNPYGIYQD